MNTVAVNNNNNHWIPAEVSTTAFGITLATVSSVAAQFLIETAGSSPDFSINLIVREFAMYSCGATAIAGMVVAVYSAVRLCQKVISDNSDIQRAITATTIGSLSTALVHTIGNHCWVIAPSFEWLAEHSIVYAIGTNLAWQACYITGIAGIVFTTYAAYRTGQAIVAAMNPTENQ